MKQKIIIVDESDNIIGYKDRESVESGDIYRVSALWVTNSQGEILLARRALTKTHSPGEWGTAVAGTVEEGESYLDNIIKEAKEEIGLERIIPKEGPKVLGMGKHNFFVQWYTLITDRVLGDFVIDKREVVEIRWVSRDVLEKEVEADPSKFFKSMGRLMDIFCDNKPASNLIVD